MRTTFFLAFAAFSLLHAYSATGDDVVLKNGDLEQVAEGESWPAHWGRQVEGMSWEKESGGHYLRMHSQKPGQMILLYREVAVPPSVRALELTWRWRCTGLKRGKQSWFDARLMLGLKGDQGQKITPAPPHPNLAKDTDGWQTRSVKFLVPEGTKTLELMPTLFQVESGTLDFDDWFLTAIDPAPLEVEAKAKAAALRTKQEADAKKRQRVAAQTLAKDGSLIPNGSFETIDKKKPWPANWPGKETTTTQWLEEDGGHFLRLHAAEPGKMVMLYHQFSLPADTRALELTWRQRVTGLKPGKEPWFDARTLIEFKDMAGKKLKGSPSPAATRRDSQGWVEKQSRFLVPEGAITMVLMPSLFQVQSGTLDLDDFLLKPIEPEPIIAAAKAAEADRLASIVPAEQPKRESWPSELHVDGKLVLTTDGKPVRLQGVNIVSLEWIAVGERVMKASLVALEDWKANIIRLPVAPKFWFGKDSSQKDGGAAYRQLVSDVVTLVANRGAYVLLDLHQFGPPRQEHVDFWASAAPAFKNHPAVLFDLFNEPHGMSWDVWQHGGEPNRKEKPGEEDAFISAEDKAKILAARRSVGMQKLLDTVRDCGARNVVLVGGLDYAFDLSGMVNGHMLDDRDGNGIILSTHIYPWKKGWEEKVLVAAGKHPIFVGEVGADVQKVTWMPAEWQEDAVTWVPAMLGLIQKHEFHWTAFSFHPRGGPPMLEDWKFTPSKVWGEPVKRAFAGEKFTLDRLR